MRQQIRYFELYKPFKMITRFGKEPGQQSLADLDFEFPKDVYPVGRLDSDSEGLLILTNDKKLNHILLNPLNEHKRNYLIQVDGQISQKDCDLLSAGVKIKLENDFYHTKPCDVSLVSDPEGIPERIPPIRFRKNIPTSWIKMELVEGKNRQIRKMTAFAGFPTLRLIRCGIGNLSILNFRSGEIKELTRSEIYDKLNLNQRRQD